MSEVVEVEESLCTPHLQVVWTAEQTLGHHCLQMALLVPGFPVLIHFGGEDLQRQVAFAIHYQLVLGLDNE